MSDVEFIGGPLNGQRYDTAYLGAAGSDPPVVFSSAVGFADGEQVRPVYRRRVNMEADGALWLYDHERNEPWTPDRR